MKKSVVLSLVVFVSFTFGFVALISANNSTQNVTTLDFCLSTSSSSWQQGIVASPSDAAMDICLNSTLLDKFSCGSNNTMVSTDYPCSGGCFNGACIPTDPTVAKNQTWNVTIYQSASGDIKLRNRITYLPDFHYVNGGEMINGVLNLTCNDYFYVNNTHRSILCVDYYQYGTSCYSLNSSLNCPATDLAHMINLGGNYTATAPPQTSPQPPTGTSCSLAGGVCSSNEKCQSVGGTVIPAGGCAEESVCCSMANINPTSGDFSPENYCSMMKGTLCDSGETCFGNGAYSVSATPNSPTLPNGQICCVNGKCMSQEQVQKEMGYNNCSIEYNDSTYHYYYYNQTSSECPEFENVTSVTCTAQPLGASVVCIGNATNAACYRGSSCPPGTAVQAPPNMPSASYLGPNGAPSCVTGCFYSGKCIPFGYRVGSTYCSIAGNFTAQLTSGSCDNNFQCSSNLCVNSQCVTPSLIQQIINFFSKLLGI